MYTGYVLSRQLSASKYQTLVISPRSYFVFTPLLNSTAVGTLEFRTTMEPIRNRKYPNVEFMQGWADNVDFKNKTVHVEESVVDSTQSQTVSDRYENHSEGEERHEKHVKKKQGKMFDITYDKLVVSVGCYNQTFGTPGVKEHAYFLKDVADTRRIRKRILECFEIAALPTTTNELRKCMLNFAIVGGGPTGMEFSAELSDLVNEDMLTLYPHLKPFIKITVYDVAPTVLNMFDDSLTKYAVETFRREGIEIKTEHHVEDLSRGLSSQSGQFTDNITNTEGCYTLRTKEEGSVGVGLVVWTTGNMMNPFVQKALETVHQYPSASATLTTQENHNSDVAEDYNNKNNTPTATHQKWVITKDPKTGAILVDSHLRVQLHTTPSNPSSSSPPSSPPKASSSTAHMNDVFALGDNSMLDTGALPATAQTANQQALWLGKRLNKGDVETQTFSFKDMGVMTYLGNAKGLVQTGGGGEGNNSSKIAGRTAWVVWKGAYLTMSVSWRNRILIAVYW